MSTPIDGIRAPSIHGANHLQSLNVHPPKKANVSLPTLPIPLDLTSAQSLNHYSIQVNQLLEEELDALIEKEEREITNHMDELNQAVKDQKMVKGLIEVGKWAHEYADTTKGVVQDGIEFLETVLPKELLEQSAFTEKFFEEINQITSYGGQFLTALNMGLNGLAMILKSRILATAKSVLAKLQEEYHQKKNAPKLDKHIPEWKTKIKKIENVFPHKELRKLKKAIKELNIKVKIEEENLSSQKIKFGIGAAKNFLSFFKIPLKLLPIDRTLAAFKILSGGLSTVTTTLGIILAGFALHKNVRDARTFKDWKQAFRDWKAINQPTARLQQERAPSSLIQTPTKDQGQESVQKKNRSTTHSLQNEEQLLLRLMRKYRTIDEIRSQLKNFDILLHPDIKTEEELFEIWDKDPLFRQTLTAQYADFKGVMENFDQTIQASQDLLEKRKTLAEKKVFLLKPHFQTLLPKIKELKRSQFEKDLAQFRADAKNANVSIKTLKEQAAQLHLPLDLDQIESRSALILALNTVLAKKPDTLFDNYIAAIPMDRLLHFYVDHQETIEQVTKNALKEMVSKKLELENSFIKLKTIESKTLFTLALVLAVVSITLAIIGLVTTPVAGAGFILLGLSAASTAISLGLFAASYYQAYHHKPEALSNSIRGVNTRFMFSQVIASIQEYRSLSKKKKLQKTAAVLQHLHQNKEETSKKKYEKAFAEYEKASLDYALTQSKANAWEQRVKNLQNRIHRANWQDFVQSAGLTIGQSPESFDTLQAFSESLQAMDMRLISDETKALFQTQLGLDIDAIQAEAAKNPSAVKKALQKFFMMDDSGYVNFIEYQQERMKAGMIPSLV